MNKPCASAAVIAASFSLLFQAISLAQTASESMGFAVFECENFSANSPARSGHSWLPGNAVSGFSGSGYMEALPSDATTIIASPATDSPELQYAVTFATAGTYYLWMRGHAIDGNSMSIHAGLDGSTTTQMTLGQSGSWQWTNAILNSGAPATITIGSAGSHTLSLWMRDSGIKVMMGAPNLIRGGSHSGNIAASTLAEADLLDIVSSDYVPSALLSAALLLGDLWGDVARGIRTVTAAPAAAAGLTDRGQLQIGARGDVVRVTRVGGAAALRGTWVQGRRVG